MRLLAAEAQATGADATPEGQAYLKLLRERALTELLLRQRERAVLPTDQALDAYARTEYKARPDRFRQPDQVQARHILLAVAPDGSDDAVVKARAEKLLADLRGGADFAALARAQSADKGSAARGGDLGRFGPGKMVPEFDAAVFALRQPGVGALVGQRQAVFLQQRLHGGQQGARFGFGQQQLLGRQQGDVVHAQLPVAGPQPGAGRAEGSGVERRPRHLAGRAGQPVGVGQGALEGGVGRVVVAGEGVADLQTPEQRL